MRVIVAAEGQKGESSQVELAGEGSGLNGHLWQSGFS